MKKIAATFDATKIAEGVWPNEPQQLLLQAALLDSPDAQQAWAKWQEMITLDAIDPASWKLIPLVYVNMKRLKIDDPLLAQTREIHFYHWRCNQQLFQQSARFLDTMQEMNVPVMILKGVALAHLYYPDTGSRPMADLDILVPFEKFRPICQRLTAEGWIPTVRELDVFALEDEPSFGLQNSDGFHVDVHGHVLHANCTHGADDEFWAHAQTFTIKDRKTMTLAAEDHLLHVISHGVRWCNVPPFRWIADVWWILAVSRDRFDWERLTKQARFHQVNLEIFYGLKLMDDLFSMNFPSGVLDRLEAIPSSGDVHVQYVFNTSSVPVSGWARAMAVWRGSGQGAPVYRLDGKKPQVRGRFLSLVNARRIFALIDYAAKALIRITLRLLRNERSSSEPSRIHAPSPPNSNG